MFNLDFTWLSDTLYVQWLLQGTLTTLVVSIVGMFAASAVGVAGAAVLHFRLPWMHEAVRLFVELFRNTPPLVQLFILYFVSTDLGLSIIDSKGVRAPLLSGFTCVILSLMLYNGALAIEIIRSGIAAVPIQTVEGVRSLGYSSSQIFLQVELPISVRLSMPALTNNVVSLIKTSAQASLIGVGDVMYYASQIMLENFRSLEVMIVIWTIYVTISFAFVAVARFAEHKMRIPGYGAA